MNEFYKVSIEKDHPRKPVFKKILDYFEGKPINILNIGVSRLNTINDFVNEGGADFYWCDYLLKNGGSLLSIDIDPVAIQKAFNLLSDFLGKVDFKLVCDDGIKYIDNSYNLIYLDGSDSNLESLRQLELSLNGNAVILCDDFHGKFLLAREVHKNFELIDFWGKHEMAIYWPDRRKLITKYEQREF